MAPASRPSGSFALTILRKSDICVSTGRPMRDVRKRLNDMPNHPNRSRRRKAPGHNPTRHEIRQLREEMELTQTEFGRGLYAGLSTVQSWEDGTRRCPGLTWEYACLLWGFPEVARAREIWRTGADTRFSSTGSG